MNPRISILIESRRLEAHPADDGEVERMWLKALRTWRSAASADLDADSRFTLGYQAAFQAATALLRAAGYRVVGRDHHHATFAAAAALGVAGLTEPAREMNDLRLRRHEVVYEAEEVLGNAELAALVDAAGRLLAEAHRWISAQRPGLALAGLAE